MTLSTGQDIWSVLNKQMKAISILEEGVIFQAMEALKELREGERTFRARGTEPEHKLIKDLEGKIHAFNKDRLHYCPEGMETMMNEAEVVLFPLVIAEGSPWGGCWKYSV